MMNAILEDRPCTEAVTIGYHDNARSLWEKFVDHVVPLKRGGADAPYNMQWQTTEAAKIKDRTE